MNMNEMERDSHESLPLPTEIHGPQNYHLIKLHPIHPGSCRIPDEEFIRPFNLQVPGGSHLLFFGTDVVNVGQKQVNRHLKRPSLVLNGADLTGVIGQE